MSKKDTIDQVNQLIDMGKEKGFLTYAEVNDVLPSEVVSPDQIDDLMIMFGEMDIEIVEGTQKVKLFKPKIQKTSEDDEEASEQELTQVGRR
jgi:RNA polymerase primary sigma factor